MKLYILFIFLLVKAERISIPENGKVMFGAWLDTSDKQAGDRPKLFNTRMGFNATCFQYAQNIPNLDFDLPDEQVPSSACIMLTIYPKPNPWNITNADIEKLSLQLIRLTINQKFNILLRIAPEMNGNWNEYGQQAEKYVVLWKRIVDIIRIKTNDVSFVWAPSTGASYPYNPPRQISNDTMDTNNDGIFDKNDDPYSPYYPGNNYVDWVGLSIYHYGLKYPWIDNVIAQPNNFVSQLNDHSFYDTYKHKPVMVSEGAASFHKDTPKGEGVGEVAMKRSFWRQWLTNDTLFNNYSQLKMVNIFEFTKREEETLRDFSISVNGTIRTEFLKDFSSIKHMYVLASYSNCLKASIFYILVQFLLVSS
jgi:hypothetical protein